MQNKPNSPNVQFYINIYDTKDYKNFIPLAGQKNKPNSNPNKANLKRAKMNVKSITTKDYRKKDDFEVRINKPNSNPISVTPKMSANAFLQKGYENETTFRPQKNKPKQTQFQNPTQSQRQASFAHQISRVDLPLGKSKQIVTSRPSALHLCSPALKVRRRRVGTHIRFTNKIRAYPNNRLVMRPSDRVGLAPPLFLTVFIVM